MLMKQITICILLLTCLSSCQIYRAYQRPELACTDSLFIRQTSGDDTSSIADLRWEELFTDPDLQALIDTGIANNSDLRIARLRVDEAEASLMTARLAYLPSVSLTPQGAVSAPENAPATRTYDLAVSAEWEIDIFGKTLNTKRGAKSSLEQQEAYRQAVQTQVIATIANSYYTLLMLDRQLEITRNTSEIWEENLRVMKVLKLAGQATEMAVAQTDAERLSVAGSVLSIERQIAETENALCTLIGITPRKIERSSPEEQHFPDTLSAGIPLQLLSRRPDIRQAEAALATAYYATNVARSAFYPSVTLSGAGGWTNAAGAAITNPGQWLFTAIASLTEPLFNRGRNIANLKIAKAQQEEAEVNFRQSILKAGEEVNNALIQWQTAKNRLILDRQQAESLKAALRSSELLMQHSSQNYLEVLTARQALLQAELNTVSDWFDKVQGIISLYHALGGGC